MKKVLHRSFKPAKCKIALQMAGSRLKILKNKKDTQIKQLRRELAHLLESGQTQTAQIRVEHVVREEKTVAAYELVGLYCELLVARLGVIDSQKNCPNDLKEAVASVLYASQRLSDVTEFSDIVKHFSAKYGKDFVSAAISLQPDSGVSRLLVEKLSVKAPDVPTKIKILTEIAAEHNVTWKAESLVESDPKETVLLSGEIGINSDPSIILSNELPPEHQAPATVNLSQNSYATDGRSSRRTTSTDFNTGKTSDHYHQDPRPCGDRADGSEDRHPNPGYGDSSPWETEFVDATTAARAAAESAERASFAARAAAELSSKERMTQNSSSYDNLRNGPPHRRTSSGSSNVQSIGFAEEEMSISSNRQGDQSTTTKAKSSKKTVDERSENASWSRGHSRDNSMEMRLNDSFPQIGREKQQTQPGMDDINLTRSEDVLLKKQSSRGSHSSNFSDDNNVTANAPSILEESRFQSTGKDTDSRNHSTDVVDNYSLFFDKPQFDTEDAYHDEPEQGSGFSLLGSKTPDHMPTETNTWSFKEHSSASTSQILEKEKTSSPIFDDAPTTPPASLHEPEPSAKFDDYDRDSESEEDKGILPGPLEEKPKLTSHKSPICEVPDDDDLGRYFFPSDTEDQGDDSRTQEDSDSETPTGLKFGHLAGELEKEKTLPPYGMSPPRDKTLSKSVKDHAPTDVVPSRSSSSQTVSSTSIYTQKARNPDKRPSTIPPDSSSSDDETETDLAHRVSIRNQDKSTESRASPSHLHSHVGHEEEIPTRASIRSQERTTPASASASYFHSMPCEDEDEKEVGRDDACFQTKPTNSRFSRRTKGQGRESSSVSEKADKVSHDQEYPPKLNPEAKPLDKQQGLASSSNSLPETDKVFHYQESHPKPTPEAKSLAEQEQSSSPPDDAETTAKEKASHVHPKLPDYEDIFAKLGALRR